MHRSSESSDRAADEVPENAVSTNADAIPEDPVRAEQGRLEDVSNRTWSTLNSEVLLVVSDKKQRIPKWSVIVENFVGINAIYFAARKIMLLNQFPRIIGISLLDSISLKLIL
ncbi:PREDICTED: uncharacterized protein LOC106750012 [Dinoponera quadriceps]|uniref:Uncharacterized protein LOC106750012 n=1 Tax=Dinoponera quadriceps TaxID=609295 RepID=A0A6P3Y601_DINQU|nr:PREDICTED: uncharacterized protein LOC106750012 [Dinoponera quadriceps]